MITKFKQFLNEDYNPLSKRQAAEDLYRDYKYATDNRGRLNKTFTNNIIVYHGTTKAIADKIEQEGFFKDGFFMATTGGINDDSSAKYARMRADLAGEKGAGKVLKMEVDPRVLLVNDAGEIESRGDLYRLEDGTWTNKDFMKTEGGLDRLETIGLEKTKELLGIKEDPTHVIGRWIVMFLSMIRHYYYNEGLTQLNQLEEAYRKEIDVLKDMRTNSPRKFTNTAKEYNINKEVFSELIDKLDVLSVKDFIAKEHIKL